MYVCCWRKNKEETETKAGLSISHHRDYVPTVGASWGPENTIPSSPEAPPLFLKAAVFMLAEDSDCTPTLEAALRNL